MYLVIFNLSTGSHLRIEISKTDETGREDRTIMQMLIENPMWLAWALHRDLLQFSIEE